MLLPTVATFTAAPIRCAFRRCDAPNGGAWPPTRRAPPGHRGDENTRCYCQPSPRVVLKTITADRLTPSMESVDCVPWGFRPGRRSGKSRFHDLRWAASRRPMCGSAARATRPSCSARLRKQFRTTSPHALRRRATAAGTAPVANVASSVDRGAFRRRATRRLRRLAARRLAIVKPQRSLPAASILARSTARRVGTL